VGVRVVAVEESGWRQYRDLRLRMLADTPIAFGETLAHARRLDEAQWRFRARRAGLPGSTAVAAVDEATGEWVGTMGAFTHPLEGLFLVSVFVAPTHRGRAAGVADRLLDEVLAWARREPGAERIFLHVHEDNARARAFYRRRGFTGTGVRRPYDLDPTAAELEMVLELGSHAV
jgi:RimJ/RimL family protein N-acetyltransferase